MDIFEPASDGKTKLTLKVDIYGKNFVLKMIAPFSKGYIRKRVRQDIFEGLQRTANTFL